MLPKWDTLLAVLGSVTMVTAIYGIAHHGPALLTTRPEPAKPPVAAFGGAGPAIVSGPRVPAAPTGQAPSTAGDSRGSFLLSLVSDGAVLAHGEEQYAMFCAACHGLGNIGDDSPSNLFNNRWVHGGSPTDIENLIRIGYLDTGMPGWDGMLPDETIEALVAYLLASQDDT